MMYIDVLFPVSLGPLTYRCPERLADRARPGMLVSAPLRARTTKGVIMKIASSSAIAGVKDILDVHGDLPVFSGKLLKLLEWMADYYLARQGLVLKQAVPKEMLAGNGAGRSRAKVPVAGSKTVLADVPAGDIAPIVGSLSSPGYRTLLLHAPSLLYEFSLVPSLVDRAPGQTLIILPEISAASRLYHALSDRYGERLCLLHSGISAGRRSDCIRGLLSGKHDIVIGTRLALFAPLKNLSLIFVLQEHSGFYKLEEGVRFNARDVAVMRGYIEKCTVLLSSITPCVDSYFNALSKKYSLIRPSTPTGARVRTVDMRSARKVKPGISKTLFDAARKMIAADKKIMFLVNRRGYSTLLLCRECGYAEVCPGCGVPLILHKEGKTLRCHYCGMTREIPERCGRCGSVGLELLGMGTQRVQEDLDALFGISTVRFDSDRITSRAEIAGLLEGVADDTTRVIVGTRMMTKAIDAAGGFFLAAVLNVDTQLNFPDFRASEKTYMEMSSLKEFLEPSGQILIQTRFPQIPLFRYLKDDDYPGFVTAELLSRKDLRYPPYAKLLEIRFRGGRDLPERITRTLGSLESNPEVLGPTETRGRDGKEELSLLLKSADRALLRKTARRILKEYGNDKGVKITVDVDPY